MKLWLVRHAQPLVAAGICYGRLDMAADADATAECAARLAKQLPGGLHVISSPLQRCEQLALALHALRPDLAYKTDARLQEMDFGQWEGRAWRDIDRSELEAWTGDFAQYAVGGDGESVTAFMARVGAAFDALPDQGTALWITHAGVIRAAELLGNGVRHIERADQWPLQAPNYGQWRTLDLHTGQAHHHTAL
ncbi:histidine phosphatase family protein [Polaromonas sp. CG_9.11]|uniref:histidine phosphatase family protein n=1 Tax=Polaromonas sp. CG_9.11 TaxID=2787730 RepID=UPI0018C8E7D4|nr:histidine phosphatase family protein [Polaromonas sp. CG_9.11]MBG6076039.1 alpha-ribazole phosphatase [Polaromonas sp. CG_9.11]